MPTCLITGATGMVGSEVLAQALEQGRQIAVLARDLGPLPAASRFPSQVRVLAGDIRQPDWGLSPSDLEWMKHECDEVMHLAARVSFQAEPKTGEPYHSNIDGTRHLLALSRKCQISRLGYVSTAYVCGDRTGRIAESDLEAGQNFRNDYERSKYVAERLIAEATWLRRATVFRPSVVVGHSQTGVTAAFHGIYAVMQAAWRFEPEARLQILERAGFDPDARLNLVPVDWVARSIWSCWDKDLGGHHIQHLTHPQAVSLRSLVQALGNTAGSSASPDLAPDLLSEVLGPLRDYLKEHPSFESSLPTAPPLMDQGVLEAICRFATTHNFRSHRSGIDLARLLAALPAADRPAVLRLEFEDGEAALLGATSKGLCRVSDGSAPAIVFASRSVFDQLLRRSLDLNSAVFSGRLVLEAEAEVIPEAMVQLSRLVEHLGAPG